MIEAFVEALGDGAVARDEATLAEFRDPYAYAGWDAPDVAAVLFPETVEQVQAIVRVANELRVPLWTSSQGRNLAYGGAAPRIDSVLVSLRRMNRILELDEELAYALVEPGVSFFDLAAAVREQGLKLLVSVPVLGWGSVVGNTLEHGWGYAPTGDHAANECGMEVVLPTGELLRTGMGALPGSRAWQTSKRGFGPTADGIFMQSNLGIVTKLGVWLTPQPEVYAPCRVLTSDLERLLETLRGLLLDRTLANVPLVLRDPPSGRWSARFALYGAAAVVEAQLAAVREVLAGTELTTRTIAGDAIADAPDLEPIEQVMGGVPGLAALQAVTMLGGEHGGQLDVSPVTPNTGRDATRLLGLLAPLYEEAGFAFGPGVIVTPRSLVFTSHITFDTTDEERAQAAFDLYPRVAAAARDAGYGLYRAHLRFMDLAAAQYDFGEGALARFNRTLKDALDPNGILSPGKQGIWPRTGETSRFPP